MPHDNKREVSSVFRELFKERIANSPVAWVGIAEMCDNFAKVLKGDLIVNLTSTVRAAEEASAMLFCAILTAKREHVELQFFQEINKARGGSFGARLINFVVSHSDADLSDDLRTAWAGIHGQMAGTIEMMVRELEPSIAHGPTLTPEQAVDWVRRNGGLGQLHWKWMNIRRHEKTVERYLADQDRKRGAYERRLKEAQAAGFDSIETHDSHIAEESKRRRASELTGRFDDVRKDLITRAKRVRVPQDGKLMFAHEGHLFVLSDKDEFDLLSCAASVR